MAKPMIGLTAALMREGEAHWYKTNDGYVDSIVRARGVPLLLTPTDDPEDQRRYLEQIDGLLIPGGEDTAPCFYGEEPHPAVTSTDRRLDRFEIALVRLAREEGKPILGICRGHQLLNIAWGGTLYQDIPSQFPGAISHYQHTATRDEPFHRVTLEPESWLARMFEETQLETNTFHHQGVKKLAPGFRCTARTADGLAEGLESSDGAVLGVQWHPESMSHVDPVQQRLFDRFVERCAERR